MTSQKCPDCGMGNDAHTFTGHGLARPDPGDVSVCLYCSQINVFTDKLTLRPATRAEAFVLFQDPDVRRAVAATVQVRRGR